ncbi:MAG: hypothetical protein NVS3B7_18850 [Candidatus Elarobacter sp.]
MIALNRSLSSVLLAGAVVAAAMPSFAQGTPPAAPAPAGTAQGAVVRFTGQLLDVRGGYVYFTTGDAFKLGAAPRIADYDTGKPTTMQPRAKLFARAILDPVSKDVVELDLTQRHLPPDVAYAQVTQYVATKAMGERAPEIVGQKITGREVAVEFNVFVPPTTPLNAEVYISTDASGWNPQAIKLDRIDGTRYRAVRRFASGTKFVFRVTRGSWNAVEVGENGLAPAPHPYFATESDAQSTSAHVYGWSDTRANSAPAVAQPGAIPTPYNPNPFPGGGLYPRPRVTPPGGFPTPRPGLPNKPPR